MDLAVLVNKQRKAQVRGFLLCKIPRQAVQGGYGVGTVITCVGSFYLSFTPLRVWPPFFNIHLEIQNDCWNSSDHVRIPSRNKEAWG